MFKKKKYLKDDPEYILQFIRQHPFASFVTKDGELLATHIPVLAEGPTDSFMLFGHIAESSEQIKYLKDGMEALLLFHGPQSYVSASWYLENNISTWDYSAVHINVKLNLQSQKELVACLKKLIYHFEKDEESPHLFHHLQKDMVEDHLKKIRGFWMEPVKVQAIAKFHQGFDRKDLDSITGHLENTNSSTKKAVSENIKKENDPYNQ